MGVVKPFTETLNTVIPFSEGTILHWVLKIIHIVFVV